MKKLLKRIIVSILDRIIWGGLRSPEAFLNKLRSSGVKIGEGTVFFDPRSTIVDCQNPKLITIGNNVKITAGCRILTHDYSWCVPGYIYGDVLGALGTVDIGDNVFVGMNTIILRNTVIGDNVIIGSGSVVSGIVESDSVYVGVPAKKIMSMEDFYNKRKNKIEFDIRNVLERIDVNNDAEVWTYLREYACFFQDAPEELKKRQMMATGNYQKCEEYYKLEPPMFRLDDFK